MLRFQFVRFVFVLRLSVLGVVVCFISVLSGIYACRIISVSVELFVLIDTEVLDTVSDYRKWVSENFFLGGCYFGYSALVDSVYGSEICYLFLMRMKNLFFLVVVPRTDNGSALKVSQMGS